MSLHIQRICVKFASVIFCALVSTTCALTNERQAPFVGRVVSIDSVFALDSAYLDTLEVDLSFVEMTLIYDRQLDGNFDDTLQIFGDENGEFAGVILYDAMFNLQADRLQRSAEIVIPKLGIDTFVDVVIQFPGGDNTTSPVNDWGTLFASGNIEIY